MRVNAARMFSSLRGLSLEFVWFIHYLRRITGTIVGVSVYKTKLDNCGTFEAVIFDT